MYKFTIIRKTNLFSKLAEIIQDITAHEEDYRICALNEDVADAVLQAQLVEECHAEDINECPTCHGALEVSEKHIAICTKCGVEYDFSNPRTRFCFVRRELFIKFLGKSLNKQHNSDYGDLTHFGDVNGRTIYYSYSPDEAFFSGHNMPNSAIIIGNHKVKVEPGWQGHPVYLRELFYIEDGTGKICFTNMKGKLFPPIPKQPKASHAPIDHDRCLYYLELARDLLSEPWNEDDFRRDGKVKSPTVQRWFRQRLENAKATPSKRTICRDLGSIYDPKTQQKNETIKIIFYALMIAYQIQGKDKNKERIARATHLANYIVTIRQEEAERGTPIEFSEQAIQYDANGKGYRVSVVNTHEEFYQDLDERMAL